jgi:uncharacterized protein (DUF58 family)
VERLAPLRAVAESCGAFRAPGMPIPDEAEAAVGAVLVALLAAVERGDRATLAAFTAEVERLRARAGEVSP